MSERPTSDAREHYSNPVRPARLGLLVVGLFLAVVVGWGAVAPLSGASIAEGILQVQGRVQSVQHPYGGVVRELRVGEGDRVTEGDVLIVLDGTESRAKLEVLRAERAAALAALARLAAEREMANEPEFADELTSRAAEPGIAELLESERSILTARINRDMAAKDVILQRITQLEQTVRGVEAQIAGLERQSSLLEEEASGARKLLEKGFAPRTRVLELERTASELRSQLEVRQSEKTSAVEAIGQARLEIAQLDRDRSSRIADEVRQRQARLAEIDPQITAASDVVKRATILAPTSGQVVRLAVFTEGGVVAPGAHMLDIVPSDSPLFVEARLPLRDITQIRPGHEADIRLVSTPRNQRPRISGTVSSVSADRLTDERTGAAFYALHIALDPGDVADAGVPLQTGMPVEVVMATRSRTLVDYLTSPLFDELSGAFREN